MSSGELMWSSLSAPPSRGIPGLERPLAPGALVEALRGFSTSYYAHHRFHTLMHEGRLTRRQLQGWAANRLAYQRAIPRKDAAILSNCPDSDVRREWLKRIIDHDGTSSNTGGIELWIRLGERMQILYVLPDYFETAPKPCYGGWGRQYLVVMPDGRTMPCHGATQITTLAFDSARERSLQWIWEESPVFQAFRGDDWMREPCRSCSLKALDFGGCRCQAFALTGSAQNADPVCTLSPDRLVIDKALASAGLGEVLFYRYRQRHRTP